MSPVAFYRQLLALAGPSFVLVAFIGRLPLAMSQMGTLLLVSHATGSYAAGGLAAGMLAVANALCSPVGAALSDRFGQRPVVLVQSLAGATALVALVVLAASGTAVLGLACAAAVAGVFLPQIGPLARVRWRPITAGTGARQPRLVETAFSYEGAADEASFVLGPALLGLLLVVDPQAGLLVAASLLALFGAAFAVHPTARQAHAARQHERSSARLLTPVFLLLLAGQAVIGIFFGSVQTGTSVIATSTGQAGMAGLVHAVLGVGSVIAGLALAGIPGRIGYGTRVAAAAGGLLLFALPLLWVDSLGGLTATVLVLGFFVAPYMISNFTLGERSAPPTRVGAAMTLLAAATGLGYAVGSATAGRFADGHGHAAALAVTVVAAAAALVLAVAGQPLLRGLSRPARAAGQTTRPSVTV